MATSVGTRLLLLFLGTAQLLLTSAQISCRNSADNAVDWWAAIKFPSGDNYAIIDNSSAKDTSGGYAWTTGSLWASPSSGALAQTLRQLYTNRSSSVGYLMWNDEFPDGAVYSTDAHAKGVMGYDASQGFYLVHSVPKFPSGPCPSCENGGRGYLGILLGQQIYGQSFLCISMAATNLDAAARAVGTSGVWIYDHHLPSNFSNSYPHVETLTRFGCGRAALVSGAPATVYGAPLNSLQGQLFASFQKRKTPPNDPNPLYERVVEPTIGSGMLWETWQNGAVGNNMGQSCTPYFSFTVATVRIAAARWNVTRDHSKFGVTAVSQPCMCSGPGLRHSLLLPPRKLLAPASNNAVCIGDMNRQKSQNIRGGGTVCFLRNNDIWVAFSNIIEHVECASEDTGHETTPQASSIAKHHNWVERVFFWVMSLYAFA